MHNFNVNKIYLDYKESKYIFALQLKKQLPKNIVRDRAGVARWAHNPKVVGSNPSPATNKTAATYVVAVFILSQIVWLDFQTTFFTL